MDLCNVWEIYTISDYLSIKPHAAAYNAAKTALKPTVI